MGSIKITNIFNEVPKLLSAESFHNSISIVLQIRIPNVGFDLVDKSSCCIVDRCQNVTICLFYF